MYNQLKVVFLLSLIVLGTVQGACQREPNTGDLSGTCYEVANNAVQKRVVVALLTLAQFGVMMKQTGEGLVQMYNDYKEMQKTAAYKNALYQCWANEECVVPSKEYESCGTPCYNDKSTKCTAELKRGLQSCEYYYGLALDKIWD